MFKYSPLWVASVGGRFFLVVVTALLFVQVAAAFTVSDVAISYRGQAIDTLAPNKELAGVTLTFTVSGPELADCRSGAKACKAFLDLRDLGIPSTIDVMFPTCFWNQTESAYHCSVKNLRVKTTDEQMAYVIKLQYGSQILPGASGNFPIQLDTTPPRLTALETGFCTGVDPAKTCYIGRNTLLKATFTDTMTSYEYKLVMFQVGPNSNNVKPAERCVGKTCETTIQFACSSGSLVRVAVVDYAITPVPFPSREDAQNAVDKALTINAVCDMQEPTLEPGTFRVYSAGMLPTLFETAQELVVEATALEAGEVSLFIDTDGWSDAEDVLEECTLAAGKHICSATVGELFAGEHDITIVFRDGVGNEHRETKHIIVLESTTPPEDGIDFFTLDVLGVTPDPMNRIALDLATANSVNYPLLVDYTLIATQSGAVVLRQDITNMECRWAESSAALADNSQTTDGPFDPSRSLILKPSAGAGETNRMILNFATPASEMPDTVFARCSYEIYVKKGTQYYTSPEIEEFTMTFRLKNAVLGQPGQAFVDEIRREEERMDSGVMQTIEQVGRVGATLDEICSVYETLNYGMEIGATTEAVGVVLQHTGALSAVGKAVSGAGSAIYVPLAIILGQMSDSSANSDSYLNGVESKLQNMPEGQMKESLASGLNDLRGKSGALGFLLKVCDAYNCRTAAAHSQEICGAASCYGTQTHPTTESSVCNPIGSWFPENPNLAQFQTNLCAPDYSRSLIASLGLYGGDVCYKGVVYHLSKYRSLNCGYLSCLKEQSLNGQSISICKDAKSYKLCTTVADEVMELPFLRVISHAGAYLNSIVQNLPMVGLQIASNAYCEPGTGVAKSVAQQLADQVANQFVGGATGGVADVGMLKKLWNGISGIFKAQKAAPVVNKGGGKDQPVGELGTAVKNLPCHIMNAVWHMTDLYALQQGAPSLYIDQEKQDELCAAALCNEGEDPDGDCERGGSYIGWVGDVKALRQQAVAYRERYDKVYKQWDTAIEKASAGYETEKNDILSTHCSSSRISKCASEYQKSVAAWQDKRLQLASSSATAGQAASYSYDQFLADRVAEARASGNTELANKLATQAAEFSPIGRDVSDLNERYPGYDKTMQALSYCRQYPDSADCKSLLGNKDALAQCTTAQGCPAGVTATVDKVVRENNPVNGVYVSKTVQLVEFSPQLSQQLTACLNAFSTASEAYSVCVNAVRQSAVDECVSAGNADCGFDANGALVYKQSISPSTLLSENDMAALNRLQVSWREKLSSCKSNDDACLAQANQLMTQFQQECQNIINTRAGGSGVTCTIVNGEWQIKQDGKALLLDANSLAQKRLEEWTNRYRSYDQLLTIGADFLVKWLTDKGYLDNLKLSNWDGWGGDAAAAANRVLNPDEWEENLCSGFLDLDVDEPDLLELSDSYGPVLTFAAERRFIENDTHDYNIYTVMYYLRADDNATRPPEFLVRFLFKPGHELNDSGIVRSPTSGERLARGDELVGTYSSIHVETFTEFCVRFDKNFPDYTGEQEYCRPIVESAFDRGSQAESGGDLFG